jgi:hypothetical protein
MSSFVESLNLRPQEKRLIVGIGVIAFIVLNYLFVLPHFKDYAKMKWELGGILRTNAMYSEEIAKDNNPTNGYKWKLRELAKGGADSSALQYSKAIQLQTTIARKAQEAGVSVQTYDPVNLVHLGTNVASQFFESESIRISIEANETNLVDFLYNVGNDPAMIRVREWDLHPLDANRYKLKGQITLTADYKKSDKDAAAKSGTANNSIAMPNPAKATPPPTAITPPPQRAGGPAAALPPYRGAAPTNTRGANLPPGNRGAVPPGQRVTGSDGRASRAVAPPPYPTVPPRTPPPAPGNNQ